MKGDKHVGATRLVSNMGIEEAIFGVELNNTKGVDSSTHISWRMLFQLNAHPST